MTQLRSEKFAFNFKTFSAIWLRCIGSSSFLFLFILPFFFLSLFVLFCSVQFSSVQYFYSSNPVFRFVILFYLSLPLVHIIVHGIRHSQYIRAIRNNKFCFLLLFLSVLSVFVLHIFFGFFFRAHKIFDLTWERPRSVLVLLWTVFSHFSMGKRLNVETNERMCRKLTNGAHE